MADTPPFPRLVPGFDFLQDLVKGAGAAMPGLGQWVAPTLDPDELGKRIEELRTVQFWLEQNARVLATTVQALEVQRMTLSTLKSMNVSMGDMADALKVRPAPSQPAADPPAAAAPSPSAASRRRRAGSAKAKAGAAPAAQTAGAIDPMQWWGALTRQFTDLAAQALREGAAAAPAAASSASSPGAAAASPSGASAGSASAVAGASGRSAARKAGGEGPAPAAGASRKGASRTAAPRRPSSSSSR